MTGDSKFVPESDSMVEVWDRGDVPGVTSQRTRLESVEVVDEMVDDDFHKFVWKGEGGFTSGKGFWGRVAEQDIELGFATIPNDAGQEGYPWGAVYRNQTCSCVPAGNRT